MPSPGQVFLKFPAELAEAKLLFHVEFDGSEKIKHVPTEIVPPAFLPPDLRAGAGIRVTGDEETLLKSALRNRTWLALEHIRQINAALGVECEGDGHGRNKNYIKVDHVTALVKHVFKHSDITDQERSEIIAAVTTRDRRQLVDTELAVLEVLQHVDEEEKRTGTVAERLSKMAREKLAQRQRTQGREEYKKEQKQTDETGNAAATEAETRETPEAKGAGKKRKHEDTSAPEAMDTQEPASSADAVRGPRRPASSPPTLRSLLPHEGNITTEIALLRDPSSYGYRACYPFGY